MDWNFQSWLSRGGSRVAPHVGAWIEIILTLLFISLIPVAPHVGAWIEISNNLFDIIENLVAPHVGAQELFY